MKETVIPIVIGALGTVVAEPISMSTPQMNYVNENSQNNRKEQRWDNSYNKWQFILSYLQAYM